MTVDRIENGFAVVETDDGRIIDIPLSELPDGIAEGTVLIYSHNSYIIDDKATEEKRARLASRTRSLFK
ncbi:MAG: DUF3006 domain-containing protein [Oscillospiraceae bacterium]